jgi:hypothetical protein
MSHEIKNRLIEAGWAVRCERSIDVDIAREAKSVDRISCLRATKGDDQIVVRAQLGHEESAMRELYREAKAIDSDLQHVAMLAGSGEWVIDLSQVKSGQHGTK